VINYRHLHCFWGVFKGVRRCGAEADCLAAACAGTGVVEIGLLRISGDALSSRGLPIAQIFHL
jgi:hypothetical protein